MENSRLINYANESSFINNAIFSKPHTQSYPFSYYEFKFFHLIDFRHLEAENSKIQNSKA